MRKLNQYLFNNIPMWYIGDKRNDQHACLVDKTGDKRKKKKNNAYEIIEWGRGGNFANIRAQLEGSHKSSVVNLTRREI